MKNSNDTIGNRTRHCIGGWVGPGSGLKDWLKSLKTFSEFACTYCSMSQPRLQSRLGVPNIRHFFNVRLPLSELQQCDYYAVTCSVATTPYRPPPPYPCAFVVRRVTTYFVGQ